MFNRYLQGMAKNRRWLAALAVADLVGFAYGVDWYWGQLAGLPWYAWPFTADCPMSALFLALICVFLLGGRRSSSLEGLGYVAALTYGLWTMVVIGHSWLAGARPTGDDFLLFGSHLGMVAEVILLASAYRPVPRGIWVGGTWLAVNAVLDYAAGLYPTLPPQTPVSVAFWALVILGAAVLAWGGHSSRSSTGQREAGAVSWLR